MLGIIIAIICLVGIYTKHNPKSIKARLIRRKLNKKLTWLKGFIYCNWFLLYCLMCYILVAVFLCMQHCG